MERIEVQKLLAVISTVYPNFKVKDATATVDAWSWALDDYDYNSINMALKTYIQTTGEAFPPSVSQLIAMTRKPQELTALSDAEAWALVKKAVRNGNYGSEEEYAKLPPTIQKAVGNASTIKEWASMDSSELNTVVWSNFRKTYNTTIQRNSEIEALPHELKALIGLNASLALEG